MIFFLCVSPANCWEGGTHTGRRRVACNNNNACETLARPSQVPASSQHGMYGGGEPQICMNACVDGSIRLSLPRLYHTKVACCSDSSSSPCKQGTAIDTYVVVINPAQLQQRYYRYTYLCIPTMLSNLHERFLLAHKAEGQPLNTQRLSTKKLHRRHVFNNTCNNIARRRRRRRRKKCVHAEKNKKNTPHDSTRAAVVVRSNLIEVVRHLGQQQSADSVPPVRLITPATSMCIHSSSHMHSLFFTTTAVGVGRSD